MPLLRTYHGADYGSNRCRATYAPSSTLLTASRPNNKFSEKVRIIACRLGLASASGEAMCFHTLQVEGPAVCENATGRGTVGMCCSASYFHYTKPFSRYG